MVRSSAFRRCLWQKDRVNAELRTFRGFHVSHSCFLISSVSIGLPSVAITHLRFSLPLRRPRHTIQPDWTGAEGLDADRSPFQSRGHFPRTGLQNGTWIPRSSEPPPQGQRRRQGRRFTSAGRAAGASAALVELRGEHALRCVVHTAGDDVVATGGRRRQRVFRIDDFV